LFFMVMALCGHCLKCSRRADRPPSNSKRSRGRSSLNVGAAKHVPPVMAAGTRVLLAALVAKIHLAADP
jgi:hypothetical protein